MLVVLTFLKSPLGRYALGALAVLAALLVIHHHGYSAGVKAERAKADKQIAAIAMDLSICKANGSKLKASIDRQNAALTAIQEVSDRKVAEAEKAAQQAQKGRAKVEAEVAKLLRPVASSGDACKDVLEAVK